MVGEMAVLRGTQGGWASALKYRSNRWRWLQVEVARRCVLDLSEREIEGAGSAPARPGEA